MSSLEFLIHPTHIWGSTNTSRTYRTWLLSNTETLFCCKSTGLMPCSQFRMHYFYIQFKSTSKLWLQLLYSGSYDKVYAGCVHKVQRPLLLCMNGDVHAACELVFHMRSKHQMLCQTHGYDPETKWQPPQWKSPQSQGPTRATVCILIVYCGISGVVHRSDGGHSLTHRRSSSPPKIKFNLKGRETSRESSKLGHSCSLGKVCEKVTIVKLTVAIFKSDS